MLRDEMIYDWNEMGLTPNRQNKKLEFDDETLRDGLQSPSVTDPPIEEKLRILHLMNDLGVDSADIGLPASGPRAFSDVTKVAQEIVESGLAIRGSCAARTLKSDITPVIEISDQVGMPLCVDMFIGSSAIRKYVEEWSMAKMLQHVTEGVKYAVDHGLPVMFVTEDTSRAHPDTISQLYAAAIEYGAKRVCLCDTVGHSTPYGVWNMIKYVQNVVRDTGEEVKIDFHGHNDRGLALINTLTAVMAGVDRVHGCGLGIGERSGNTSMDLLLINLKLLDWIDNDIHKLSEYCQTISKGCQIPIPDNYPVIGRDAFRTATGVHAAAVIKAMKKEEDTWLADAVYCGVPASMVGKKQAIEIGPMSGKSNVVCWLEERGYVPKEELVDKIFDHVKQKKTLFTEAELRQFVEVF